MPGAKADEHIVLLESRVGFVKTQDPHLVLTRSLLPPGDDLGKYRAPFSSSTTFPLIFVAVVVSTPGAARAAA